MELEIPPDTLAATGNTETIEPEEYPKPAGNPADIRRAAQLLAEAKMPAIIAGGGTIIGRTPPRSWLSWLSTSRLR